MSEASFPHKPFDLTSAVAGVRRVRAEAAVSGDPPLFSYLRSTRLAWLPDSLECGLRNLESSVMYVAQQADGSPGGARNCRCRDPLHWGHNALRKTS